MTLKRFARVYCLIGFAISGLSLIVGLILASEQGRDAAKMMSGKLAFAILLFGLGFAAGDFRDPGIIINFPWMHQFIGAAGFIWSLKIYSELMGIFIFVVIQNF